jgi:hypothetical protein
MKKAKHSRVGKRLITAMREVVDHVEGKVALPLRYVEVPEDVDVKAIRSCRKPSFRGATVSASGRSRSGNRAVGGQKAPCAPT